MKFAWELTIGYINCKTHIICIWEYLDPIFSSSFIFVYVIAISQHKIIVLHNNYWRQHHP